MKINDFSRVVQALESYFDTTDSGQALRTVNTRLTSREYYREALDEAVEILC